MTQEKCQHIEFAENYFSKTQVSIKLNNSVTILAVARTDVVEASVRAYVNAMNEIVEERATRGEKVPHLNLP